MFCIFFFCEVRAEVPVLLMVGWWGIWIVEFPVMDSCCPKTISKGVNDVI